MRHQDAIKHMRHPASYSFETDDVVRGEHEAEKEFIARKNAYVVFHRYNNYQVLFSKINASRYRFMAQLGKDQASPFDDLRAIVNEIKASSNVLSRLWAREIHIDDEQWKEHRAQLDKYEAIFWSGFKDDDPIDNRLDNLSSG